jgi:hypothetical protein
MFQDLILTPSWTYPKKNMLLQLYCSSDLRFRGTGSDKSVKWGFFPKRNLTTIPRMMLQTRPIDIDKTSIPSARGSGFRTRDHLSLIPDLRQVLGMAKYWREIQIFQVLDSL